MRRLEATIALCAMQRIENAMAVRRLAVPATIAAMVALERIHRREWEQLGAATGIAMGVEAVLAANLRALAEAVASAWRYCCHCTTGC